MSVASPETKTTNQKTGLLPAKSKTDEMIFVPFASKDAIKLSVSIVQKMICVPTKSGHNCNAIQAMKFMMLCRARGLNPFEGDAFLIGYDTKDGPQFSLITAHQAFLKRAENHPEYDGMQSGVIVLRDDVIQEIEGDFTLDSDKVVGGWATVYFKNRQYPIRKRIKLSTFNTGQSRWSKDPAGMICKCAEADALRSAFPTMFGGMRLEQEPYVAVDSQSGDEIQQSPPEHDLAAEADQAQAAAPQPSEFDDLLNSYGQQLDLALEGEHPEIDCNKALAWAKGEPGTDLPNNVLEKIDQMHREAIDAARAKKRKATG